MVTLTFQKYNVGNVSTKTHPFIFHIIIIKLKDKLPGPVHQCFLNNVLFQRVSLHSWAHKAGLSGEARSEIRPPDNMRLPGSTYALRLAAELEQVSRSPKFEDFVLSGPIHSLTPDTFPSPKLGRRSPQVSTLSNEKLTKKPERRHRERTTDSSLLLPRIPLTPHQRHRNPGKLCWQKLILKRILINSRF